MIFRQAVVRIRAGTRTSRGGDVSEDWSPGAVTRVLIEGVSVQPNFQTEDDAEGRNVRATGYRVITQPGDAPDITGRDRIEYRGTTHAVSGEVAYWPAPDGRDHIEFSMTEWKGA